MRLRLFSGGCAPHETGSALDALVALFRVIVALLRFRGRVNYVRSMFCVH